MKSRWKAIGLLTIIVAFVFLTIWPGKKRTAETTSVDTAATNKGANAGNDPGAITDPASSNLPTYSGGSNPSKPQPTKGERAVGILSEYNDVPIEFYGRVQDQFSNAVADAAVNFSVRIYNGTEDTVKHEHVMTDTTGYFTISGYNGESLGLVPSKEGYVLASTGTLFKYSRMQEHPYVPDARNPTVIKMWKLQGAEPLVSIKQQYKVHYTGKPMIFDLLTGQIEPVGGDITITVDRTPGTISGRNRLDWSVRLEAVDGGLLDSGGQEAVAYAAPESGYKPSMSLIFSTNSPYKWAGGFTQGIFLTSRNGRVYSKLGISLDINDAPDGLLSISFSGVANTNGSRNWEGDPNTMKSQ